MFVKYTYRDFFRLKKDLQKSFPDVNLSLNIYKYILYKRYYIMLHKIEVSSEIRESGLGTKVIDIICDFADRYDVKIYLTPSDLLGSDLKRLIGFYERFGFRFIDTMDMCREPMSKV